MNARIIRTLNKDPKLMAVKLPGNQYMSAWPDIQVYHRGRALLLEGKSDTNEQTKIQVATADKIERKGGVYTVVVREHDEAIKVVAFWRNRIDEEMDG